MLSPAPHPEEDDRLHRLRELGVLDTSAEEAYDRLTRLAARLFGAPIALVSLVDANRQWFKSRVGLDATETPRDISFCGHAVASDAMLVVEDASGDPRFADNPLVIGDPRIRFYAGAPLRAYDGLPLGTICIIDRVPRHFDQSDRQALADLAVLVESELRRRALLDTVARNLDKDRQLRTLLAALPEAAFACDVQGVVITANPASRELFRRRIRDMLGRPAASLFADGSLPSSGESEPVRQCVRGDGTTFPGLARAQRLQLEASELTIFSVRDVSDWVARERLKDEFISVVSHELRTPLTSILASLDLLIACSDEELPSEARMLAQMGQRNTVRLARLVNDVLDIEKIASGRMTFRLEPVILGAAVAEATEVVQGLAQRRRTRIATEGEMGSLSVQADGGRLVQVLTNLLSNAIKFSPEGSVVTLRAAAGGRTAHLEVRDQGPGVSAEFAQRIFQRFAQAEAPLTRSVEGSGLGLSICKGMMEGMGGSISHWSEPGRGATFRLELPLG